MARQLLLSTCFIFLLNSVFGQVVFTWQEPEFGYCAPTQVQFTDLTSPNPSSWEWEITGPITLNSIEQNPLFTFSIPGNYTVCLSVNNNPTISFCEDFTIHAPPQASFSVAPGYSTTGTEPLTVCFVDESIPGDNPIVEWYWDLGVPPISTGQNPCATYTAGEYDVELLAVDANGCYDDVVSPPGFITCIADGSIQADFEITADSASLCSLPAQLYCTDQSTGPVDEWLWIVTGPENFISIVQNPGFVIITPGTYIFELTVNDVSTYSQTLTLPEILTADFTADMTTTCNGVPVLVNLSSISPIATQFEWAISPETFIVPGGWESDPNPQIIFTEAGIYDVSLLTTSTTGCSLLVEKEDYIKIYDAITVDIVSDAPGDRGCVPLDICFDLVVDNLPVGISVNTVEWSAPGGSPPISNMNLCTTYNATGDYVVTANVSFTEGCADIMVTKTIHVGDLPTLSAEVAPGTACINDCITGSAVSDLPETEFSWYFEAPGGYVDGGTGTSSNVGYCFGAEWAQPFTVLLVGENNGCKDTVVTEVFVNPPVADFTWEELCPFASVNFAVNPSQGVFTSEGAWYITGQADPVHTFTNIVDADFTYDFGGLGYYEVTLVLYSDFTECGDSLTQVVELLGYMTDFVAMAPHERDCPPLEVTFHAIPPGIMLDSIHWWLGSGEDPIVTTPPHEIIYTYTEPGISGGPNGDGYYDIAAVGFLDGCVVDSIYKDNYIRAGDGPTGEVSFEPATGEVPLTVTFNFENIERADSIKFNPGIDSQFIVLPASIDDINVVYESVGEFQPEVILCNSDCEPKPLALEAIIVSNVTGLYESIADEIGIYPNPVGVKQLLRWEYSQELIIKRLRVLDLSGRSLLQIEYPAEHFVKVDNLAPGAYILILETSLGIVGNLFEVLD